MIIERYSKDHEWLRCEGDVATVGITEHAAEQLGDVVFVELPEVGRKVTAGEACAVVESVKAASDVYAPATGEVIEVNADLPGNPAWVNEEAHGKAWFFKLRLSAPAELDALMDAHAYHELVEKQR
jgi:glycine cleavage system H protein